MPISWNPPHDGVNHLEMILAVLIEIRERLSELIKAVKDLQRPGV